MNRFTALLAFVAFALPAAALAAQDYDEYVRVDFDIRAGKVCPSAISVMSRGGGNPQAAPPCWPAFDPGGGKPAVHVRYPGGLCFPTSFPNRTIEWQATGGANAPPFRIVSTDPLVGVLARSNLTTGKQIARYDIPPNPQLGVVEYVIDNGDDSTTPVTEPTCSLDPRIIITTTESINFIDSRSPSAVGTLPPLAEFLLARPLGDLD